MIKKMITKILLLIAAIAIPLTVFAESGEKITKLLGVQVGASASMTSSASVFAGQRGTPRKSKSRIIARRLLL
jgi:hypothetical protein